MKDNSSRWKIIALRVTYIDVISSDVGGKPVTVSVASSMVPVDAMHIKTRVSIMTL